MHTTNHVTSSHKRSWGVQVYLAWLWLRQQLLQNSHIKTLFEEEPFFWWTVAKQWSFCGEEPELQKNNRKFKFCHPGEWHSSTCQLCFGTYKFATWKVECVFVFATFGDVALQLTLLDVETACEMRILSMSPYPLKRAHFPRHLPPVPWWKVRAGERWWQVGAWITTVYTSRKHHMPRQRKSNVLLFSVECENGSKQLITCHLNI
jgi:hypothetical protein